MASVIKQNKSAGNKLYIARRKRRIYLFKKTAIGILGVSAFLSLIVYGLHRPQINISNIQVDGTSVLNPEFLKDTAKVELSGSYFWLVPKTNIFFYPKKAVLARLTKQFKRIDTIEVGRIGFSSIYIKVTERPEKYLWCGRDLIIALTPENKCYFVDSGGYVFSPAPYYSGSIFFEFYGPLRTGENDRPVGGAVLPEEKFRTAVSFKDQLEEMNVPAVKVFVDTNDDYQFVLKEGGKIFVSGKNDLEKNAEYLKLALDTDPLKSKMEKTRDRLMYLDARFGNKVFFKFK